MEKNMEFTKEFRKKMNGRKVCFFLICLGLAAVRLFRFPEIPGGLNQDGAMGAVDAAALVRYGTDRFGTWLPAHFRAWGYGQMSVLLAYLTTPFIRIFGLTKLAMRLPILLASLAGAGGVYGIVKKVFGEKEGMAVLLFIAVNPWHFMQSRWALDCNLFPHMFVLGICFLLGSLEKKKNLYLSMLFFALCMYCYGVSFYMVPFFLLTVCALLLGQKKVTWKEALLCLLVYMGIAWPIYGTMLINFMKWETVKLPFVTMEYFEGSIRSGDILFFSEQMGSQLVSNLRSLIRVVFLQKEDLLWNSIKGFGTLYLCSTPFVLLGALRVLRGAVKEEEPARKIGCQVLLCYWIFALLTGILINSVNVNRINIIFYIHIIFAVVGICFVVRKWKPTLYLILLAYAIQSAMFFQCYFTDWAQSIDKAFYGDFVEALDYAREQNCDYYYITPDTQYQGSWNVSEILTLFVFDIDARYFQGATDSWENKSIPYWDRFRYVNPPEASQLSGWNVACIIRSSEAYRFSQDTFQITMFGDYAVVISQPFGNKIPIKL